VTTELFQRVVLKEDLPDEGLHAGDVGVVVERYPARAGVPEGYEVEFFGLDGGTVAVVSVPVTSVRPATPSESAGRPNLAPPIDFTSADLQLLLNQFKTGHVVLFAGAGFSVGARSGVGKELPTGAQLPALLAAECGVEYANEDLPIVFDYAQKCLGTTRLGSFLSSYYRDCTPAPWHTLVAGILWSGIYTINIDDVLQQAYAATRPSQRLRTIICPAPFEERDPWFETVQCVHLHGSVLDFSKGLTFSPSDFAAQTATPNPWYQALIDDMYASSVLFVGTRLSEPPFHHYLALRSERLRGQRDYRAKAFLVAPGITPIRRRHLEEQGIVPIDAKAEDFFVGLAKRLCDLVPSRVELLKNRYPDQIDAIAAGILDTHGDFLREFDHVRPSAAPKKRTARDTFFFEGAEPTWDDIAAEVDAPRSITPLLVSRLQDKSDTARFYLVVGHAGSGKSSLLRRLAYELSKGGDAVYFFRSPNRLSEKPLADFLRGLGRRRAFLFIDDAQLHLATLEKVFAETGTDLGVTVVAGERPHAVLHHIGELRTTRFESIEVPLLDRRDSVSILERLETFGLLGALRGKTREQQIREFMGRSRKQLLVALKEATSGKGFDIILANEFATLASESARVAYTVACLAYMHGAPVARRHLLAVMPGTDIEKARVLNQELRGVVVPWREGSDFYTPRHRVIARQVSVEAASFEIKQTALVALLTQVAPDLTPSNIRRRTAEYIAYRGIINLDNMLQLFGDDYDTLAQIYSELDAAYADDFLFRLQFGRAELHFDHFERAENYLNQSLAIRPKDRNVQAWHQMGVLRLKRARFEANPAVASEQAKAGEEILREQIATIGNRDAYPYAALVQHKLRYLRDARPPQTSEMLEEIYALSKEGLQKHPLDEFMKEAHEEVTRAYLMQPVKASGD